MKKTIVDYFNILLAVLFVLLAIAYGVELIRNKEFSKVGYTAKILSEDKTSPDERSNRIRVIDAKLFNTSNNSDNTPTFDSPTLIYSKDRDSVYFWVKHDLFPDSLNLKYFSIDEKKFYVVNSKISNQKIEEVVINDSYLKVLRIIIEPKGKISVQVEQKKNDNLVSTKLLQDFQAKETTGQLNDLVYETSLGEKYNMFPSIKTVSDYSDMMIKKYSWKLNIETENSENVYKISPSTFDNVRIGRSDETFEKEKIRNIPEKILIDWGNTQKYGSSYSFEAKQILDAFNEFDKMKSDEPIIINFKLHKNNLPKCEISKGSKVIPLKDLYPDLPIHYAN